jgi:hypothetical protein
MQLLLVMATVDIDDTSVYRLEGSNSEQKGGLIIKKKVKKEPDDDDFKMPHLPAGGSLLGLDKLAGKQHTTPLFSFSFYILVVIFCLLFHCGFSIEAETARRRKV